MMIGLAALDLPEGDTGIPGSGLAVKGQPARARRQPRLDATTGEVLRNAGPASPRQAGDTNRSQLLWREVRLPRRQPKRAAAQLPAIAGEHPLPAPPGTQPPKQPMAVARARPGPAGLSASGEDWQDTQGLAHSNDRGNPTSRAGFADYSCC